MRILKGLEYDKGSHRAEEAQNSKRIRNEGNLRRTCTLKEG
jgi:hypothetical protein